MTVDDYKRIKQAAQSCEQQAQKRSLIFGLLRLFWFILIIYLGSILIESDSQWSIVAMMAMVVCFLVLTFLHARIDQELQYQRNRGHACQLGMERIQGDWSHGQDDGQHLLQEWHPYAHDLDVVGEHGLFALLNTTASQAGTRYLADLLLDEEQQTDAQWRQCVQSLSGQAERRVNWLAAMQLETRLWSSTEEQQCMDAYCQWLSAADRPGIAQPLIYIARTVCIALTVIGFLLVGWTWLWTGCIVIAAVTSVINDRALSQWGDCDVDRIDRLLRSWKRGLDHVVAEEQRAACFSAEEQAQLQAMAKAVQRQLKAWHGLSLRSNPFWRFGIGAMVLSDWYYRRSLEQWRSQSAVQFSAQLQVLARIDVLHAFGNYAAEQGGCYATMSDDEQCLFSACNLAHPLMPSTSRVGNDIQLQAGEVLLLTGANASGKSTFLRSIALAVVMARVGLPLCADSCQLQPQRLATVMRIHDALWQGLSRFQAEVKQLKQVMERAQSPGEPVMLILDEILGGTNSEERRIGTLAFIKHFQDYRGLLLITTHDLALTEIADSEPERMRCFHFADRAVLDEQDADVRFDYKLRPGVLQSTNALQVMQAAGLPVE